MIFKTHILFASNCALMGSNLGVLSLGNTLGQKIAFLGILAIGAVFCDIDEPRSFIGRKFKGLSHFLNFSFGHRGFTHFAIFPLILMGIFYFFFTLGQLTLAFILGIFLHQAGDMLTKSGIKAYFFPFFRETSIGLLPKPMRFYTAGTFEYFCLLPLMAILFFGLFYLEIIRPAL